MLEELLGFNPSINNVKRNIALLETLNDYVASSHFPLCRQISLLLKQLITNKGKEELAKGGNTFLWENILLFIGNPTTDNLKLANILIYLFDAFYDFYPSSQDISLSPVYFKEEVYFPQLNLALKIVNETNIKKIDSKQVSIKTTSLIETKKIKENITAFKRIILSNVSQPAAVYLLKDFLPEQEIIKLCSLTSELEKKFFNAFEIIKNVDITLYNNMHQMISYVFPIRMHEQKTRASFTITNLNGIIFISDGGNLLDFCEAFIHEFYHNELNTILQFKALFNQEKGNVFYSPWRADLRPIGGLFHAIYVFVGVASFYTKVLCIINDKEGVQKQLSNVSAKLYIAFRQIDEASLTNLGKELLVKLYNKFLNLLKTGSLNLSSYIAQEMSKQDLKYVKDVLPLFLTKNCEKEETIIF